MQYPLDLEYVKKLIPHREPFIFIDEISFMHDRETVMSSLDLSNLNPKEDWTYVISAKRYYDTEKDTFLKGHFPEFAIVPGVILVESIAQTAACMMGIIQGIGGIKSPLVKINNAKFKNPVRPGDTAIMTVYAMSNSRKPMFNFYGNVSVNGKVCAEAEITAMAIDIGKY